MSSVLGNICLSNILNTSAVLSFTTSLRIFLLPLSVITYTCSLETIRPTPFFLLPITKVPSPSTTRPGPPIVITVESSIQPATSRKKNIYLYISRFFRPNINFGIILTGVLEDNFYIISNIAAAPYEVLKNIDPCKIDLSV